jgi:hypothetical protein
LKYDLTEITRQEELIKKLDTERIFLPNNEHENCEKDFIEYLKKQVKTVDSI